MYDGKTQLLIEIRSAAISSTRRCCRTSEDPDTADAYIQKDPGATG
jgi:hypothetical protein